MPTTVAGVFERMLNAEDSIDALQQAGFERNAISLVAQDVKGDHGQAAGGEAGGVAAGAGAGAAIGGAAGLVLGLAALAVPGIGPLIAAGPLAAALGSAGIGAAAGGLIGALTGMNIPEGDAEYYAEAVRRGGAVVIVKTSAERAASAREILDRNGGRDAPQPTPARGTEERAGHSRSSEPEAPQLSQSSARIYVGGLELGPRTSRFEDFDREYRSHFQTRFPDAGYTYEQFSPAYRYGHSLANDERFPDRDWTRIEPHAEREWEERNPGTWPQVRDAVRQGWESGSRA